MLMRRAKDRLGLMMIVLAALLAATLTACRPGVAATPVTVTDALGRTVGFEALPENIAIGGRANFMLNNAIYLFPEAPERVSALAHSTQAASTFVQLLDPEAEAKTRFAPDAAAEELASAQPDLVLLKSYMKESVGDTLEQLDIPVVYLDLETPEQYERDLAILGTLLDNEERAREVWAYYEEILQRAANATAGLTDAQKPRVLLLQYSDRGGDVAFRVPPASWIQTQMVMLAGGDPVWLEAAQGGGWATVNLEQIAAWNADQIYIINYFGSAVEVVERLQQDPQWSEMRAVQAGQLIPFAGDLNSWDQADSRWGLGLLWLGTQIQPERFADVDIEAETIHFFETYYGLDRAIIEAELLPLYAASQAGR
jgi:iron complex transport system substrate-binding protein